VALYDWAVFNFHWTYCRSGTTSSMDRCTLSRKQTSGRRKWIRIDDVTQHNTKRNCPIHEMGPFFDNELQVNYLRYSVRLSE